MSNDARPGFVGSRLEEFDLAGLLAATDAVEETGLGEKARWFRFLAHQWAGCSQEKTVQFENTPGLWPRDYLDDLPGLLDRLREWSLDIPPKMPGLRVRVLPGFTRGVVEVVFSARYLGTPYHVSDFLDLDFFGDHPAVFFVAFFDGLHHRLVEFCRTCPRRDYGRSTFASELMRPWPRPEGGLV